jgi:antitoxin (DNA-binding transcriptional repressor) of toxin-antitoxin stability system
VHMATIATRDLRNHTAAVLRQVAGGARVTITLNRVPVAEIRPLSGARRASIPKTELVAILTTKQADPGLREDLASLAGETTDDLGPLR